VEDVQSSQQQFMEQFANVINSSNQMQHMKQQFEQGRPKRESVDQS